ncbi:MAG: response regulator [Acidobacteriota bacterium]
MSPTELQDLLRQAIEFAKSGDKGRARSLLIEVTEAEPKNEVAWMWRASVSLTPKDAAWCLTKVLNINPANRQAQEWLDKIRQLQDQPPAVTRPLVPASSQLLSHPGSTDAHQATPVCPRSPTVGDLSSFSSSHLARPDRLPSPTPPQVAITVPATVPAMPSVTVPRPTPPPTHLSSEKTSEIERVEHSLRPEFSSGSKVILAVDDSLTVRRVITQALESHGYRVITAADAYEALSKLKDITPDLVILDVALPSGMDGYRLCKHIRAEKSRRAIPVIMLSSRESFLDKVQSRLAGAVQYLSKPIKTEDLLLSIRRHLKA